MVPFKHFAEILDYLLELYALAVKMHDVVFYILPVLLCIVQNNLQVFKRVGCMLGVTQTLSAQKESGIVFSFGFKVLWRDVEALCANEQAFFAVFAAIHL